MRILAVVLACLVGSVAGTVGSAAVASSHNHDWGHDNCVTVNAAGADRVRPICRPGRNCQVSNIRI